MKTTFHPQWLLLLALGILLTEPALAAEPLEDPKPGRGPIVNVAADAVVGCLVPPFRIDGTHTKEELTRAFQSTVDHYARAGVPYLFFNVCYMRAACPSQVWDTYWDVDDPDANTTGWPRAYWLVHKMGVDPFAVSVARARERGISPWLSMRMNDTHYIDDPTKTSKLWQQHPELRRAEKSGYDFTREAVQDHYLALIAELMDRYNCDGVELDWMRFPQHFKPGQEQRGREALNEFMRRARELAIKATAKRGHPVQIAARIPAVPEFAQTLGMDGVAWAREGWVDMLILASVWRPSDTDIPIHRWRRRIGPAAERVLLVAGTDLWLQGTPGGKLMSDDLQSQRGFTAAMLDRGADLVYLFNHFNVTDFRRTRPGPDGRTIEHNEHAALLETAGRLQISLQGPRRHVVTFHDPAGPNIPNPKQLPALLEPNEALQLHVVTGPKPTGGEVIVRVGLDNQPGVADARLAAQLNGQPCTPIDDLAQPLDHKSYSHDPHRVFHVAHVAQRMIQFNAPVDAMRRGENHVELRVTSQRDQKVIWLEIYIVP